MNWQLVLTETGALEAPRILQECVFMPFGYRGVA